MRKKQREHLSFLGGSHSQVREGFPESKLQAGGAHFGQLAVSRRQLIKTGVSTAGLVLGSGLWTRATANVAEGQKACGPALPIPHLCPFPPPVHFFFPGPVTGVTAPTDPTTPPPYPGGRDPSLIYNFKGFIGQADLCLSGIGTDTKTGQTSPYDFHIDARFMKGVFVGADEEKHKGTFAFI